MSFPDKNERAKCWTARDEYWKCLDAKNVPEATQDKNGPCREFRKVFEKSCSGQWVKHFDRKRNFLQFQERMSQGYEPLDDPKRS